MRFMNSYKRLDNLCRDTNGVGITGYLNDMDKELRGACYVEDWKSDYNQLKKYRHIRNLIAHENNVYEDDICSEEDIIWLEDFYQRIIEQRDPLALCYKSARKFAAEAEFKETNHNKLTYPNNNINKNSSDNANIIINNNFGTNQKTPSGNDQTSDKNYGYGVMILLFVVIAIVVVFSLYSK